MFKHTLAALALASSLAGLTAAHATTVVLPGDGSWRAFDVFVDVSGTTAWFDDLYNNDGSVLSFSFTIGGGRTGVLTVVDAGFAGDRFAVTNNGVALGTTSAAVNNYPVNVGIDFDAALLNPDYSRGVYMLGSGSYLVSGVLSTSALDTTQTPIDATVGGLRLTVSAVPEPATLASMLAGLALIGLTLRRRAA
jgi:hypothetical protein